MTPRMTKPTMKAPPSRRPLRSGNLRWVLVSRSMMTPPRRVGSTAFHQGNSALRPHSGGPQGRPHAPGRVTRSSERSPIRWRRTSLVAPRARTAGQHPGRAGHHSVLAHAWDAAPAWRRCRHGLAHADAGTYSGSTGPSTPPRSWNEARAPRSVSRGAPIRCSSAPSCCSPGHLDASARRSSGSRAATVRPAARCQPDQSLPSHPHPSPSRAESG